MLRKIDDMKTPGGGSATLALFVWAAIFEKQL
jgi:hypothetical protein